MTLTPQEWHNRFRQQAAWTASLRPYLLSRLALNERSRVLEVGCGTGALLADLRQHAPASRLHGLDINLDFLRLAQQNASGAVFTNGDALHLPYADEAFDAVVFHFFLLWIPQPALALAEMRRVLRPGGALIAFAEPDYGGRIDHPAELEALGRLQAAALQAQGAEPSMGRQLSGLLHAGGLRDVQSGVLGGEWSAAPTPTQLDTEWQVLAADLAGELPAAELARLREMDARAWRDGSRVLFVPTFYAMGIK